MPGPFEDRADAGRALAVLLRHGPELPRDDLLVLALPRGGVPVAAPVAALLGAPLDVVVVRKLGVPARPELAMGAVGEGGVVVRNDEVLRRAGVGPQELEAVLARERAEVARRGPLLRGDRPAPALAGRAVVLVDDGLATGASARAACRVVRAAGASYVVLAVPVAPPGAAEELRDAADRVVVALVPPRFRAVGEWYRDFTQTEDDEVRRLLAEATRRTGPGPA